jgi:uncharacterized protein (TIRG00374 family)
MKNWRVWIGVAVSLVCLYLAARGIDFEQLVEALRQVRSGGLLLALGLLVLIAVLRAWRWRALLAPVVSPDTGRLFHLLNVGYLVSSVAPLRLGDVLRAFLCARLEQIDLFCTLGTLAVERLADTLTIASMLLLLLPWVPLPSDLVRPAVGIGALAAVGVGLLAWAARHPRQSQELLDRITGRVQVLDRPAVRNAISAVTSGLASLGSARMALTVALLSLAIWTVAGLQYWVIMTAMQMSLPISAGALVLCLTSLGMVVPSSPGYVGVFEYLTTVALAPFGVGREAALAYALVLHGVLYASSSLLGALGAWAEGYSYARLRATLTEAQTDGASV